MSEEIPTYDRRHGDDIVTPRDSPRLQQQMRAIKRLMLDHRWRTLPEIEAATGYPQASISAQLRHLRKPSFGGYVVEKQYVGGGLYRYRVTEAGKLPLCQLHRATGEKQS